MLRDSCYDCHSSETRLSWFDQVVPAYWLVARDVERARAHLSLSALAERPVLEQRDRLFEAVNHVRLGDAAGTQLDSDLVSAFITGVETSADPPLPDQSRAAGLVRLRVA